MKILCIFRIFFTSTHVLSDNVGWKSFFNENPDEFHDILLHWESER